MVNKIEFNPLYQQTYQKILSWITSGKWKFNQRLPSESLLAKKLSVSPGTVRKAFDQLVAERIIVRRQGKGTYLNEQSTESNLFLFFRICDGDGTRILPSSKVIKTEIEPLGEVLAKKMELKPDQRALYIYRTRYKDDEPILYERVVLPLCFYPELDQSVAIPNTLYDFLQQNYSVTITKAHESIRATKATKAIAEQLQCQPEDSLLVIERLTEDLRGKVVEYRESFVSTEHTTYRITIG